jgi:hypothetical protein
VVGSYEHSNDLSGSIKSGGGGCLDHLRNLSFSERELCPMEFVTVELTCLKLVVRTPERSPSSTHFPRDRAGVGWVPVGLQSQDMSCFSYHRPLGPIHQPVQ